jgi:hypothetical protein
MHVSKKGGKQNTTDLGVEEWRTPVGRAETTRKGKGEERRGEWPTTTMTAMQEKAKEGRRDGRDQGRRNTQKPGGEGTPIGIGTVGVRGSDERGDRRAEERQKRGERWRALNGALTVLRAAHVASCTFA